MQAAEVLSAVGPGNASPCRVASIPLSICSKDQGGGTPPGLSERLTTNLGRDKGSN